MDNNQIPQIKPVKSVQQEDDTKIPAQNEVSHASSSGGSILNPTGVKSQSSKKDMPKEKTKFKLDKKKKIIFAILGGLLIFVLINALLLFNVSRKMNKFLTDSQKLKYAVSTQDMTLVKSELDVAEDSLSDLKSAYTLISWMKYIPFLGGYVSDGTHVLNAAEYGMEVAGLIVVAVEPYADLLGFSGGNGQPASGEETAADRVDFIIKAIPEITPKLDEISTKMALVKKETDQIDPNRYPETVRGFVVRENVRMAVDLVDQTYDFITNGKPLIESAPYLLGVDEKRTYLVIFQNDKELRPTGGFITAYTIMEVDKGKFTPLGSDDIYNLDAKYKPTIPAPDPIIDYIKGPYIISKNLRLRDMNWNPDFYESMKVFAEEVETVGIKDIDGIISVDTHLLVNLLDVIGAIGVSGFGNFSTEIIPECNCPQVIYELESFADVEGPIVWDPNSGEIIYRPPNSDNRKRIIGPLMNAILSNAFGQPKEKLLDLFAAGMKSLNEKHVMFYLYDDKVQEAVESFNVAGRLRDYSGDYLHINDANLGGRKSNLYVTQEVNQDIQIEKDGTVTKTVTITYNNPEKHDGWLNSVLPNWVRVYVPQGSQLIAFEGVESQEDPYIESGKTVYAGYFELRPQGVSKVTVKYRLPFKVSDEYKLLVQKQPGTDTPLHLVKVNKIEQEEYLLGDKEFKFNI